MTKSGKIVAFRKEEVVKMILTKTGGKKLRQYHSMRGHRPLRDHRGRIHVSAIGCHEMSGQILVNVPSQNGITDRSFAVSMDVLPLEGRNSVLNVVTKYFPIWEGMAIKGPVA